MPGPAERGTPRKVAVLGAGAVGGMLGVLLAGAGHDVVLLGSDRTSTAINVEGLALRSARYGDRSVRVPARPWLTEPVDVLVVAVKAPDLLAALARVPASLLDGAVIVPLLNGIDHVPLLGRVPPGHRGPDDGRGGGDAHRPRRHRARVAVRRVRGRRERPEATVDPAELLRGADLDVDVSAPDEATLLWRKLSFLAPFALLTTRARAALGPAREADPDLLTALVDETAAAATAAGATIDPGAVGQRLATLPAGMRSSMLKDALAGAVLELDAIAGPVLRSAPGGAPVTRQVVAEILGSA